jgi:hypothetical protein
MSYASRAGINKAHVFMMMGDGREVELQGYVSQMEMTSPPPVEITSYLSPLREFTPSGGPSTLSLTMQLSSMDWMLEKKVFKPSTVLTIKEWRCEYCLSVNLSSHLECRKCGAPRTFLYE